MARGSFRFALLVLAGGLVVASLPIQAGQAQVGQAAAGR